VQCKVYTINKNNFENSLNPKNGSAFRTMNSLSQFNSRQFKNSLDTLTFLGEGGTRMTKRFNQDSKIRIVTRDNRIIKYYVKTLYIYKDEFLIGERTKPKFYGPNYFPVKLSDISRIEVTGH
jgi:hypothetical protein